MARNANKLLYVCVTIVLFLDLCQQLLPHTTKEAISSNWSSSSSSEQPPHDDDFKYRQRKVFHNLLTLPETFVARRETNRGKLTSTNETVIHEITNQQGCVRTLSIALTNDKPRPQSCSHVGILDHVLLRIYVDGNAEPSVEATISHLFGIHHSAAVAGKEYDNRNRRTVNNYLYSITANGAQVLKIPAPYQRGLKITYQIIPSTSSSTNNVIYFWSFLDYEEYPLPGSFREPLRLQIREGELPGDDSNNNKNQMQLVQVYNQRGYLLGFTMGAAISEQGVELRNKGGPRALDLWFHNGGEMLVLDQTDPTRASLMHGIGAEDAFFESCNPVHEERGPLPVSDLNGFQYALDGSYQVLPHAMASPDYASAYRAYLEHDLIPFERSFSFHMGNTEGFHFSGVVFFYGTLPTPSLSTRPLVDRWEVCDHQNNFNPMDWQLPQDSSSFPSLRTTMKRVACRDIITKNHEFLDLTYAMIQPGAKTNNKLTETSRVSVFATIPYERIHSILQHQPPSSNSHTRHAGGEKRDSCIQLEIFHDDITLIWLGDTLVYWGDTQKGHKLLFSDPYQPIMDGKDLEMTVLMSNTENYNFRAWLLGVTARSASCEGPRFFQNIN